MEAKIKGRPGKLAWSDVMMRLVFDTPHHSPRSHRAHVVYQAFHTAVLRCRRVSRSRSFAGCDLGRTSYLRSPARGSA